MEKRAVIEPGRTPIEKDDKVKGAKEAVEKIAELDADFRKRAAETVVKTTRVK
jgi:hypothetical protein